MNYSHWLILIVIYIVLLTGGWYFSSWITEYARVQITPQNQSMLTAMIVSTTIIYVVASAIPFVPGAEIGFGLLLAFGANLAVLVYVSMIVALLIAYLAGRFMPVSAIARFFGFLGLAKAAELVGEMEALDPKSRLERLTRSAPNRLVPFLLRHRYLALIVLLNMPGNSILGGGGGIAFTAGVSRLYSLPVFVGTTMLAAAPIPVLFLVTQNMG
jgi:hypothetical protein